MRALVKSGNAGRGASCATVGAFDAEETASNAVTMATETKEMERRMWAPGYTDVGQRTCIARAGLSSAKWVMDELMLLHVVRVFGDDNRSCVGNLARRECQA